MIGRAFVRRSVAVVIAASAAFGALAQATAAETGASLAAASAVVIPSARIDRAVGSLDRLVAALMRKTGLPGMAVAVVRNDRVVYAKGFGVRRAGAPDRVDADTVFQLASVSKPLASTVVAGAVGRGTIKWTDPLVSYLPGFTLADPYVGAHVTIADMFAHRSGLPDHAGDLLEDLGYDRTAIIEKLRYEPLEPFRISYAYTNFGLTAAAEAVAKASGTSWEQLSHGVLYAPLGMRSTSSRYADYAAAPNRAILHVRRGTSWVAAYTRQPDAQSPAGGASSSVRDMAQWLRLELAHGTYDGKRVIDRDALLATWKPNLAISAGPPNARTTFYGLGMNVGYDDTGRLRLSHSGGFSAGAATNVAMLPSENLGIVVLTNGYPIGIPEALTAEFLELAELGSVRHDWLTLYGEAFAQMEAPPHDAGADRIPVHPTAAQPDAAYVGTYANPYYGAASVVLIDGALSLRLGPDHQVYQLIHRNGDRFFFRERGESATGTSDVVFATNATGATTMTVTYLNETKLGVFTQTSTTP